MWNTLYVLSFLFCIECNLLIYWELIGWTDILSDVWHYDNQAHKYLSLKSTITEQSSNNVWLFLLPSNYSNLPTNNQISYNTTSMRYAIQLRTNGSVLDYSDSLEEVQEIMASSSHNLEIVDTTTASVIKVTYTELGS